MWSTPITPDVAQTAHRLLYFFSSPYSIITSYFFFSRNNISPEMGKSYWIGPPPINKMYWLLLCVVVVGPMHRIANKKVFLLFISILLIICGSRWAINRFIDVNVARTSESCDASINIQTQLIDDLQRGHTHTSI